MEMENMRLYDTKQTKEKEILIQDQEMPIYININRTFDRINQPRNFLIAENTFISAWPTDDDKIKAVYTFNFK
jgi:anaerobic ribonucleoside-triphosphate reductase